MFRMGTTVLTPEAAELIGVIADAVAPDQGELTIRGHTDSLPYKAGTSGNNWSLSAGRAEATRQALMRSGVSEALFKRIRSEERRVGKGCVSTCRSGGWPNH